MTNADVTCPGCLKPGCRGCPNTRCERLGCKRLVDTDGDYAGTKHDDFCIELTEAEALAAGERTRRQLAYEDACERGSDELRGK